MRLVRRATRIIVVVADVAAKVVVELARAVVLFCGCGLCGFCRHLSSLCLSEQQCVEAVAAAVAERQVGLVATVRLHTEERPLVNLGPGEPEITATLPVVVLGEDDAVRRHVGRKGRKEDVDYMI
jgi:hypothetical protein